MAAGEKRRVTDSGNVISQVSWTDGTTMDTYYGLQHSFQYSRNINCDDEMHGIKLATKAEFTDVDALKKCQLVSVGDQGVVALKTDGSANPRWFNNSNFMSGGTATGESSKPGININVCPGVVFQDYFWYSAQPQSGGGMMAAVRVDSSHSAYVCSPRDHPESTDESISDKKTASGQMIDGAVTAILNYNNSRLVVACGNEIWIYYPELDQTSPVSHPPGSSTDAGKTGWKKVLTYEAGTTIVGLTCSFEYLKVRAVDEGWNTKVFYYQGNNNLRSTFVYNVVDLTGVKVLRVYSINGIDYYVASIDGTDGFVDLYKLVGNTPVQLFKQRAGLDPMDINEKDPYFVGPVSISAAYKNGRFYIADAYGLFQFTYNPQGFDKGYMKWGLHNNRHVYGVCENQGFLYISTEDGCYVTRIIDTGKPPLNSSTQGYQLEGVLISREFEGKEGGTFTKMLDEVRLNYEMNPNTTSNGWIDIYVSPNNLWSSTSIFDEDHGWYHVMQLTQQNANTRTERSNLLNNLGDDYTSSFTFDRQTITYAIVITRGSETHATPIVRQIDLKYHVKEKINNVYDIK